MHRKIDTKLFLPRRIHSQPDGADPDSGVCLQLSAERLEEEGGEVAENNSEA